jgi:hypothetical protein
MWAVLAVLCAAFFGWGTSFAGPLSKAEVEHYLARMQEANADASPERMRIVCLSSSLS